MNKNIKRILCNRVATSSEIEITEVHRKSYKENGYFVIRKLFDLETLDTYRRRFTAICENQKLATVVKDYALYDKNKKPEDYVNKIQDILYDKVYMTFTEDPRVLKIIAQFIGDDITALNLMLINKPPGSIRHPPHQDMFYFPFGPADKIIAMWTAIDRTDIQNGCLYVIPGSHKKGELCRHQNFQDAKKLFHGIADEEVFAPVSSRLDLEMDPGDTIFFHPYLIHGSGPNATEDYRKAATVHYANSNCRYDDWDKINKHLLNSEFKAIMAEKGIEGLTLLDSWKLKMKTVQGPKCNL